MNANYGYDSFVLSDSYNTDGFYNDMLESIQIKQNQKKAEGFENDYSINSIISCQCARLKKNVNICKQIIYEKTSEIVELKSQLYIFYILLIVAVAIIVSQRMTIHSLNQFLYIMKMSPMNGLNQTQWPTLPKVAT